VTRSALIAVPSMCPIVAARQTPSTGILVWGPCFGIGFDILFGYTGPPFVRQSAFYGTGGFIAAYLLDARRVSGRRARAFDSAPQVAAVVGLVDRPLALRRSRDLLRA
jgi:branched-chain amino acid transport system permease protein